MHPCIRASSPSLARAHELVASQHSPCSTFEPRPSSLDIPVSATPICNNASGGSEGGIGATLLVLSSLKHLRYLQTYTYFQAQAGL
ncbi:hypothetical protein C8J23_11059 [Shewanella chilikensis]|uniref:Uncharacterized protein n=1 Tax=Shewanella chilikensis TaxID=558541 RepID=A0ABX5PPL3_9GAMM|nr:hypothetical protein C8J23_11059 [Shewanella chilikensis]